MIIDCHSHVWDPERHLSMEVLSHGDGANRRLSGLDATPGRHWRALKPAQRSIVSGLQTHRIHIPNQYIAGYVREHPKELIGFASIDPGEPQAEDELRRAVEEWELRGVALGPSYQGIHPLDASMWPLYHYCSRHRLPVLFHQGVTVVGEAPSADARPLDLKAIAARHPEMAIVVAHLGHPCVDECLALLRQQPNVYADLAGLCDKPWQFYDALVRAQEEGVIGKILLGSNFPFTSVAEAIKRLQNVNAVAKGTAMPKVGKTAIDEIIHRDTLGLLGLA